ncbi:MAG: sulfite exporter TauE/SafE family protein [Armatimonadota bacterium]|nr:sulfite exporter TauE/SafE family protein [Armatimonadota bacterium]
MEFIAANPIIAVSALLTIGFTVGVCGGFFGVGGAFIVTPALNVLGFPMVYAIGTDLAHMAGKSVVGTMKHYRLGNIDFRAAGLLLIGTTPSVRLGVAAVHELERHGKTDVYVRVVYIGLLLAIASFMFLDMRRQRGPHKTGARKRIRLSIPPMISLPRSGIDSVSVWTVICIGALTGFLAGFLGVGGGFIRMPALLYLVGMPAKIAVGTDLVEVLFSGGYGSYLYGRAGQVDITAALIMLVGAALGANLGALATHYAKAARIKRLFSFTILGTAIAVLMKQVGLTIPAAIMLFALGLGMAGAIIRALVVGIRAERAKKMTDQPALDTVGVTTE